MKTVWACLLMLGFLAAAFWAMAGASSAQDKSAAEGKKPKLKFTIGKKTTYVTGPLDKDGFIDYVAALNERLSKGVTAQTNAAALLCYVCGPRPEGARLTPQFYKWLDIKEPPENGEYLVSFYQYLKNGLGIMVGKDFETLQEMLDMASGRPWKAKQYPVVANWLELNKKPLNLAVGATRRPDYYYPLVPPDGATFGLSGALLPHVQKCRELANALTARAMWLTGEGAYGDAWQDLLAVHRLGRHLGKGGTLIEGLVGIAIDQIASGADLAHMDSAKLNTNDLISRLRDLENLPSMPPLAGRIELFERIMMLDLIQMAHRGKLGAISDLIGFDISKVLNTTEKSNLDHLNWDAVLSGVNKWYDRLATILHVKERGQRQKHLDNIEADLKKLKNSLLDSEALTKIFAAKKAAGLDREKIAGDFLISSLFPAVQKVQYAADRIEQVQSNLQLGFALVAFHRDHGRYPKKLETLVPEYVPQIPKDIFSGKQLIYQPTRNSFLLYSVGLNGKDDQGKTFGDDPPGDDLPVCMPLKKLKK